jgi:hypothetical protein
MTMLLRILTAGFAATLLFGQATEPVIVPDRPVPGNLVLPYNQIKTYLALTDQQLASLRQIQEQRQQADQAIYRQISERQTQLSALLQANSTDALAIGRLMVEINGLRKQVPSNPSAYRESALKVLTPPQTAKLPSLVEALRLSGTAWEATSLNLIDNPGGGARILPVPYPVVDPLAVSARP